jgi:hypothetical protein
MSKPNRIAAAVVFATTMCIMSVDTTHNAAAISGTITAIVLVACWIYWYLGRPKTAAKAPAAAASPRRKSQRLLLVGLAIAVLMGVFPPWTEALHFENIHAESPLGYAFILSPPKAVVPYTVRIDIIRLLLQWTVVALAVGGGLVYFQTTDRPPPPHSQ